MTPKPAPTSAGAPDGRDERWAAHREERRGQILDAAIAVIEATPEGEEIHVRQIAQEAGLGRAVLYRHFADRADLDRAVQRRILQMLMDTLVPEFELSGSIEQIIERIVTAYVAWADAHPALHRIGAAESQDAERLGEVLQTTQQIGALITMLVTSGASLLEVELTAEDQQILDPLVFGIVGQAVGTVRFWLARDERVPSPAVLAQHLTRSVWFQIDGHARDRGVVLDPKTSLDDLILGSLRAD
ncbi:TetR/AcrR family transcriptional regulator [Marmoricola sp. RAF53]|uniref:TetR/AcrR family transcriptional regulator n=1 Tax=Marmoricola sp. RAF53 TaxID=3233059 RepID=UPI003F9B81B3